MHANIGFQPVFYTPFRLFTYLVYAVFLLVGGCGGGGAVPAEGDSAASDPAETEVGLSAQPGDVVVLRAAEDSADDGVSYSWSQLDGREVMLSDGTQQTAHFVMPSLKRDEELTFLVDARRADGSVKTELHTVCHEPDDEEENGHQSPVVTEQYVVFTADKDLDRRTDLYLAMLDGSALYRLNDPLVPNGNVNGFRISPDRNYVAYKADQDTDGIYELYVANADGSGVAKLSGTMIAGDWLGAYAWAPDSSRIAYIRTVNGDGVGQLFSNTPDGTDLNQVSAPLVSGGAVWHFSWSPDSARLAYSADQNTNGIDELFSALPDGTDNVRLSGPIVAGGGVDASSFAWAPDGSRIAYLARQNTTRTREVFTSLPDGSGNVRVSHPMPTDDDYVGWGIAWAPDSSRLAYQHYYNYYYSSGGSTVFAYNDNLYTVRPDGSSATQVSAVPREYGAYRNIAGYSWAPDSSRIVYTSEQDQDDVNELYTSGADGSGNVKVSGAMVTGGNVYGFNQVRWAPDSSRIAYLADQNTDSVGELFTSAPDGSSNIRVSGPLVSGGQVSRFVWSPDSHYLAYTADQRVDQLVEIYTATPDATLNPRISGNLVFGGDVQAFRWAADGSRIVYRADQQVDNQFELFVAAPDGSALNDNISGTLTADGDVFAFETQ